MPSKFAKLVMENRSGNIYVYQTGLVMVRHSKYESFFCITLIVISKQQKDFELVSVIV